MVEQQVSAFSFEDKFPEATIMNDQSGKVWMQVRNASSPVSWIEDLAANQSPSSPRSFSSLLSHLDGSTL